MGKSLYEASSCCKVVFEEVDEAIDYTLSRLMFEGDINTLTLTENVQPALLAVSIAALALLDERMGQASVGHLAGAVAGHSLGEYTALTAAGALDLTQSAKLLRVRGQAMQKAVPAGEGMMLAILGLESAQVEQLVVQIARDHPDIVCDLANDNAPGQVVLSGHAAMASVVTEAAKAMGAKRVLPLPVSAPFHCRLMSYARDVMSERLADCVIAAPRVPIYANIDTEPTKNPERIRQNLIDQVCGRVRWRESLQRMGQEGYQHFVEIGAGKVLSGLMGRINKEYLKTNVQDASDVTSLLDAIASIG